MKPYINSLITGNSSLLGCIDQRGELIRLFWPDIDFPQHIDRLSVGVICHDLWQGASWLSSEDWQLKQYYVPDTNIAVTEYIKKDHGLIIRQSDFAIPDSDVLKRCYEVVNTGGSNMPIRFTAFSSSVSTTPHTAGILFDPRLSTLIHYKHGYYYSLSSDKQLLQYQIGGGSYENAGRGELYGSDTIGMMREGALIWECGELKSGETMHFTLQICLARDLKTLKKLTYENMAADSLADMSKTKMFWQDYLARTRLIHTGDTEIDSIYKRSLLVFALMTNKKTGALLAAPEIDEEFSRCGRYAYCWGRDAAFIAAALDKCGLSEDVEAFYRWAAQVQDEDGSWQQRFHMDGNLAPCWGLQIDEGGSIIWGILKHYEHTGNMDFLIDLWPCIKKGVEFLLGYQDSQTGLPWLSYDLWEERIGEHAYSSAAVCAGIGAGAAIAEILAEHGEADYLSCEAKRQSVEAKAQSNEAGQIVGTSKLLYSRAELVSLAEAWRKAASQLREAIEKSFWSPEWKRFVRSVRVKLNGWGDEHTDAKVWLQMNDKSITRDYTLLDGTLDISLLGLSIPFDILPPGDPRMVSTAELVEEKLTVHGTGGLMRYEYDGYIGGNPWVLTTLWAALYHISRRSYSRAREYLDWAVKSATEQDLLPEQVDKTTGKPAWVIPLTWSHAMFVLVIDGLIEAGEL